MILLRFFLALAATAVFAPPHAAAVIERIPADTAAVIWIRDANELRTRAAASPWARTWQEPSVRRFCAPLRRMLELDPGAPPSERLEPWHLLPYIQGEVVLAILGSIADTRSPEDAAVLIADVGGNGRKIAELILADDERRGKRQLTEEVLGVTLRSALVREEDAPTGADTGSGSEPETELWWATFDETFLLARTGDAARRAVFLLRRSPSSALVNTAVWQDVASVSEAEIVLLLNVPALLPLYESGLQSIAEAAKQNPMMPTADAVRNALRLEAIRGLVITLDIDEDRTTLRSLLLSREAAGLLRVSRAFVGQPRAYEAVPRDVAGLGAMTFSPGEFVDAVFEILNDLNPVLAGMAQGFLQQTKQQRGLDVIGFLKAIDRDWTLVSGYGEQPASPAGTGPRLPTDTVMTARLRDVATFETGLVAIRSLAGELLMESEFNGVKILSAALPSQPKLPSQRFAIATANGRLFVSIGSLRTLEAMLGSNRENGWNTPQVRAFVESLGPEVNSYSYSYPEAFVGMSRGFVDGIAQNAGGPIFRALFDSSESIDYGAIVAMWGALTNRGWRDASGYHQENVLFHGSP